MAKARSSIVQPAKKAVTGKRAAEQQAKQARRAAILLKHLSDATRLQIVLLLAEGERHVGGLCEAVNLGQPALSHHLALLRHGGIVTPRRQGKNNFYSLSEAGEQLATVAGGLVGR